METIDGKKLKDASQQNKEALRDCKLPFTDNSRHHISPKFAKSEVHMDLNFPAWLRKKACANG